MSRRKGRNIRPCKVDGCELLAGHPGTARSYCPKHYARWQRHGDPLKGERKRRKQNGPCVVRGCRREARIRGCCKTHAQRLYRNDGNPHVYRRGRPWTESEDRRLLDLPLDRSFRVRAGWLSDLADRIDRTPVACRSRLFELRKARARAASLT